MYLAAYFCAGLLAYVPFVMYLIALWCLFRAIRSASSGSKVYDQSRGWLEGQGNVSIFRLFSFWCFVALVVIATAIFFHIKADYLNVNC